MDNNASVRQLFGGAFTLRLPRRFEDVSELRQIPDTQEVFADGRTDQSVIVELLSLAEEAEDDGKAAAFHFESLASDNSASEWSLESPSVVTDAPGLGVWSLTYGLQHIAKFKDSAEHANTVRVFVACLRMREYGTDIVVSLNAPQWISEASASAQYAHPELVRQHNGLETALPLFQAIVQSFTVVDPSILNG
eukprot:m.106335 g.106335  ORF g.106335 m.106335 type:complete len:193 (+) comp15815_c3_seq1:65-643(+)